MTASTGIQGVAPAQVHQAWNLTELSAAVAECRRLARPICDYGRFHTGLGHAPPPQYAQIVTPPGIVEHHVADMTVSVRAATPLAELQRDLAQHHQWLPLDGADDSMTLAEIVAHNVYGPLRIGYGSMRDMLLGLRFVDADGRQITVGGRTVKNVAGYDVTRFMIGNLNTLGLLTELTLRTWALPRQFTRVELIGIDVVAFCRRLTTLMTSDASPVYLVARQRIGEPASIALGYAGEPRACDAQVDALNHWLHEQSFPSGQRHDGAWAGGDWRWDVPALVKLIVPPAKSAEAREAMELPAGSHVDLLPAHGVFHFGGNWSIEAAKVVDAHLTSFAQRLGGMRIWINRPSHTPDIAPFAPLPPDWSMLRRIKHAMDPTNLFNPTRMWNP